MSNKFNLLSTEIWNLVHLQRCISVIFYQYFCDSRLHQIRFLSIKFSQRHILRIRFIFSIFKNNLERKLNWFFRRSNVQTNHIRYKMDFDAHVPLSLWRWICLCCHFHQAWMRFLYGNNRKINLGTDNFIYDMIQS